MKEKIHIKRESAHNGRVFTGTFLPSIFFFLFFCFVLYTYVCMFEHVQDEIAGYREGSAAKEEVANNSGKH